MTEPASQHTPDGETILTIAAAVFVACCLAVWTAGQLAARIWAGVWLPVPLWESPGILWRLASDPAAPGDAWPPEAATFIPDPIAYYTVLAILSLIILTAVAAGWRWHHQHGTSTDDNAARWAKPRDLKPLLVRRPQPGRLTLGTVDGRLVATEAQHSVAVIGPAGTGKTTGFAIPALLEWDGPVIATSVKGDLLEHTIAHRRTPGTASDCAAQSALAATRCPHRVVARLASGPGLTLTLVLRLLLRALALLGIDVDALAEGGEGNQGREK